MHFASAFTALLATAGLTSASALLPRQGCPDFNFVDTTPLGPDPNGCGWKQALTCAGVLTQCGVACAGAIVTEGVNPFLDANCVACLPTSAGVCAQCWDAIGGRSGVCQATAVIPEAACLRSVCDGTLGGGRDCNAAGTC